MAVVHLVLLLGGAPEYTAADSSRRVRRAQSAWQNRPYRDAVPDRNRAQQTDAFERRPSPSVARTGVVGCCRRVDVGANSFGFYLCLETARVSRGITLPRSCGSCSRSSAGTSTMG